MVGILKRMFSRTFKVIERAEQVDLETNLLCQRVRATIDGENDWFLRLPTNRAALPRTFECREVDESEE